MELKKNNKKEPSEEDYNWLAYRKHKLDSMAYYINKRKISLNAYRDFTATESKEEKIKKNLITKKVIENEIKKIDEDDKMDEEILEAMEEIAKENKEKQEKNPN